MVCGGEPVCRDARKYRIGFFAAAKPREGMGANEIRLDSPSGSDRSISESIGERKIGKPHRALGGPDEQIRIRRQVRVDTQ